MVMEDVLKTKQKKNDEALQDSWKNRGRCGLVTEPPDLWNAVEP